MKIFEITTATISKVDANNAEIDHGDGTKTIVDLKKNPSALTKDAKTGAVKINKSTKPGADKEMGSQIKAGDKVEPTQ